MNQELVTQLLEDALKENQALFLIDLSFLPGNKIRIIVDGDTGISLEECIRLNKAIEHNLDREEEDFSLEVTSPDIAEPLKVQRQYQKNLKRILTVKTNDAKLEGALIGITEQGITLRWKAREPKPIGKGKVTVEKTAELLFTEIREAKVKIIF